MDDFECCLTPALSFLRKEGYFDVVENCKLHNIGIGPIDITKEVDHFEHSLLRV
jgi:hypothetical protein